MYYYNKNSNETPLMHLALVPDCWHKSIEQIRTVQLRSEDNGLPKYIATTLGESTPVESSRRSAKQQGMCDESTSDGSVVCATVVHENVLSLLDALKNKR